MTRLRTTIVSVLLAGCMAPGDDKDNLSIEDTDCVACLESDELEPEPYTFAEEVWPILERNCAACHVDIGTPPAMRTAEDVDQLVDQASSLQDWVYIKPGEPGFSYLWLKVTGQHRVTGGTGEPMPLQGSLSHVELGLIEQWIRDGALP